MQHVQGVLDIFEQFGHAAPGAGIHLTPGFQQSVEKTFHAVQQITQRHKPGQAGTALEGMQISANLFTGVRQSLLLPCHQMLCQLGQYLARFFQEDFLGFAVGNQVGERFGVTGGLQLRNHIRQGMIMLLDLFCQRFPSFNLDLGGIDGIQHLLHGVTETAKQRQRRLIDRM